MGNFVINNRESSTVFRIVKLTRFVKLSSRSFSFFGLSVLLFSIILREVCSNGTSALVCEFQPSFHPSILPSIHPDRFYNAAMLFSISEYSRLHLVCVHDRQTDRTQKTLWNEHYDSNCCLFDDSSDYICFTVCPFLMANCPPPSIDRSL